MANKILNMVFKATDKATPTLKQIQSGTGGLDDFSGALGGLVNPATLALGAVTALAAGVVDATNDWRNFVLEVDNLSASIGVSIEEASVMKQLMTDWGITNDSMVAAMRSMAKNGIEPSVEGFIKLRAILDNTEDSTERLALAQKLLGEQGIKQILPMLDQLTDVELINYINGVHEGAIVTDEMSQKARDQQAAINDMKTSWMGFKNTIVSEIAPAITTALNGILNLLITTEEETYSSTIAQLEKAKQQISARGMDTTTIDKQIAEAKAARSGYAYGARYQGQADVWKAQALAKEGLEQWEESQTKTEKATTARYRGYSPKEQKENDEEQIRLLENMGEMFESTLMRNLRMMEDLRRMLNNLPMVIKDVRER